MGKSSTIESFFERKVVQDLEAQTASSTSNVGTSIPEHHVPNVDISTLEPQPPPSKSPKVGPKDFDMAYLEGDAGLHPQIWECAFDQSRDIGNVLEKQTSQQIANDRLRLKTTIEVIRFLTFQGIAFEGQHENVDPINGGNFIAMVKLLASWNEEIAKVGLAKAPHNATYTSPKIQKEILHILSSNAKRAICEEIGDAKFCIIVDEERNEEQRAIVLRFVDKDGFVQERFFGGVHVLDTTTVNLKNEICATLSHHNLNIHNIRGEGYDGGCNMRGEWNGLQYLISKGCPYAYYIRCVIHRLQLALVEASKELSPVYLFFSKLTFIVNIVCAACKQIDELKVAQAAEVAHLIAINEFESGRGLHQLGTLLRVGDTQRGSHLCSISSLITKFNATCAVLMNIIHEGTPYSQPGNGEALAAYDALTSFEFVFVLHLMKEIMEITDVLCQALQCQSQDFENVTHLVEKVHLRMQLQHYEIDVPQHLELQKLSTISELCQGLVRTGKSLIYPLLDRLVRLVLTLPVSTATTDQTFSAINIVKMELCNEIEDEFLSDYLMVYIEKEIVEKFSMDFIIDEFHSLKEQEAQL